VNPVEMFISGLVVGIVVTIVVCLMLGAAYGTGVQSGREETKRALQDVRDKLQEAGWDKP
jgi:uncharacterized membrane-anchored protein YhcB (DUF1043 family)